VALQKASTVIHASLNVLQDRSKAIGRKDGIKWIAVQELTRHVLLLPSFALLHLLRVNVIDGKRQD
jgi:hypothetical protein